MRLVIDVRESRGVVGQQGSRATVHRRPFERVSRE